MQLWTINVETVKWLQQMQVTANRNQLYQSITMWQITDHLKLYSSFFFMLFIWFINRSRSLLLSTQWNGSVGLVWTRSNFGLVYWNYSMQWETNKSVAWNLADTCWTTSDRLRKLHKSYCRFIQHPPPTPIPVEYPPVKSPLNLNLKGSPNKCIVLKRSTDAVNQRGKQLMK